MPCLRKNSSVKFHQVRSSVVLRNHYFDIALVLFFFVLETMQNEGIRFRLYTYERFKRVKLLAEALVMFAMVNLDEDMCKIVPLQCAYVSVQKFVVKCSMNLDRLAITGFGFR